MTRLPWPLLQMEEVIATTHEEYEEMIRHTEGAEREQWENHLATLRIDHPPGKRLLCRQRSHRLCRGWHNGEGPCGDVVLGVLPLVAAVTYRNTKPVDGGAPPAPVRLDNKLLKLVLLRETFHQTDSELRLLPTREKLDLKERLWKLGCIIRTMHNHLNVSISGVCQTSRGMVAP